jgi:hypothetical protein
MSNNNQRKTEEPETTSLRTDGGVTAESVEEEEVESETNFVPTTFYLTEETQHELKRWFKRTELDFASFEGAERREQHEVMVLYMMAHTEEVVEAIREYKADQ